MTVYQGIAAQTADHMRQDGVTYAVSVGRRAPLHRMHLDCLLEIINSGLPLVIVIGSINDAQSIFYDPLRNPLTAEQQVEELRRALGDKFDPNMILMQKDRGDGALWAQDLAQNLKDAGLDGQAVIHVREKTADSANKGKKIKPLSEYEQNLADNGLSLWKSHNTYAPDDDLNSSDIRTYDLNNLTAAQRKNLVNPDYIIDLARKARANNPDGDALNDNKVPLTLLDLTFDRLRKEADISTAELISRAMDNSGEVTFDTLSQATQDIIDARRSPQPDFSKASVQGPLTLKVASASCNQTAGDWPRNLKNICAAIDAAATDRADVLVLEELGITGYERGDDFYYTDNVKTREMLELVAAYAAAKDPNLAVSIGHPWYFSDKDLPDQAERRKNPLFNRINNPFNVQTLITGGDIVSMSAKRYLFNYERGYEKRHFEEWSDAAANGYVNAYGKGREGTIMIGLPEVRYENGETLPLRVIPFGSPVIQLGQNGQKINVHHVICEEYWVGSRFDASASNDDYNRDSPLAEKARLFDITLALNPNASPPRANKIDKHYELCKLATNHAQVIVHTDGLGSSGSTFAQFGSRLVAQKGEIISEGKRISMKDMAYTSQVVRVKPAVSKGHAPHAVVPHIFNKVHSAPVQDGPAPWERGERRKFEEEMRDECLWMFDYMRKNKIQGITQALSGGNDSCYNIAKVRLMVDLACEERGVEGFMAAMPHLNYRQQVLDTYHRQGAKAARDKIMENMVTCVYMGTSNSSEDTLRAARELVEGGATLEGEKFEGIGGKFHYRNVERLVEMYAEIYAGVDTSKIDDAREAEIRNEIARILRTRADDTTREEIDADIKKFQFMFHEVTHEVLSVAKEEHQLSYENIQARLRQVLIMLFSNVENKLAISNPNLDEGRNSYATYGGDLHGGMISGNAHKDKSLQREHMRLLETVGLDGIEPIKALYWTNRNRPSAELQPKSKDGKVMQFDEDQLGRSFEQMAAIAHYMLYERPLSQNERKNNPTEVFQKCLTHDLFTADDIETLHDRIRLSYEKWGHAQFKIHASPIAMTYDDSIDHQSSMRTPNISANQRPEQAQMALYCLSEMAKRDQSSIEKLTGYSLTELMQRALIDEEFNNRLSAKMWTPQATDGRKMKIGSLYADIKKNGFAGIAADTSMAQILSTAKQWKSARQ